MKLLKTIRFDGSDERVFDKAAEPGEWAVSGAFAFADRAPSSLTGKTRQAFANGFLGVASFGRSTFASVAHASAGEREEIERLLAQHFVAGYGAPDLDAALPAAREEVSFVEDLCRGVLINTVFAVRRTWGADGGIKEEFRTIAPPSGPPPHARIWTVTDDDA
ncbi:MAG: hypothetical protein F9K29_03830 [Hyphomicrobiaceae bacterium]|nr:MAG: hypothetical protein F9K29_03830 [Hyphomicrobiaceae bacterium]